MSGNVVDTHTIAAAEVGISKYFEGSKSNVEFTNSYIRTIDPQTMSNVGPQGKVQFDIPEVDNGGVYDMDNLKLRIGLVIGRLADQTVEQNEHESLWNSMSSFIGLNQTSEPEGSNSVNNFALINNTMHSLIQGIDYTLGGVNLNPGGGVDGYSWQSYIKYLTSFDITAKESWMQSQGWYCDTPNAMNSTNGDNLGYERRKAYFQRDGVFVSKEKIFEGHLLLPISGSNIGIPPGIKQQILIHFNQQSFFLQQSHLDPRLYKISFSFMQLLIPVRDWNDKVFQRIMSQWKTENKIKIPFRRIMFQNEKISASTSMTKIIINRSGEIPARVVFFFVEAGDIFNRYKNPYEFKRKFGNVFLTDVKFMINCSSLDEKTKELTLDDSIGMFVRMNETLGFQNTPMGNNITYDAFNDGGFFIGAYDLTVNKRAYDGLFQPVQRVGSLEIILSFSSNLDREIRCLILKEFAATTTISPDRKVQNSFAA